MTQYFHHSGDATLKIKKWLQNENWKLAMDKAQYFPGVFLAKRDQKRKRKKAMQK